MDLSLQGKVALVTGGGRGLGPSIVRGLTQAGALVVVAAVREIEEIEREASEAPKGAVAALPADATFPKLGRSDGMTEFATPTGAGLNNRGRECVGGSCGNQGALSRAMAGPTRRCAVYRTRWRDTLPKRRAADVRCPCTCGLWCDDLVVPRRRPLGSGDRIPQQRR